jgi:hypothetical protein
MKRDKIIYWIATGLVAAGMLLSATMYLSKNPELIGNFKTLGLPDYFVTLLGVAKLLGAVVLLMPVWTALKEWAYAGFAFTFAWAVWTHIATGTPLDGTGVFHPAPRCFIYVFWIRARQIKTT